MKKAIPYFLGLLLLMGCSKKENTVTPAPTTKPAPVANFATSGGQYGSYDFLGAASNADTYTWDFGDGGSDYKLSTSHRYQANGLYSVKLTARGDGGSTTMTKTLSVTDVRGSVTFWMESGKYNVEVTIDGGDTGLITKNFSSQPDCVTNGTAGFVLLTDGVHRYTAKETGRLFPTTWSGTFTVTGGQCFFMRLIY